MSKLKFYVYYRTSQLVIFFNSATAIARLSRGLDSTLETSLFRFNVPFKFKSIYYAFYQPP